MDKKITGMDTYDCRENGFHPLIFCNDWRVAVLNYFDVVEKDLIYRMERHPETDEVFVLRNGSAWLILGGDSDHPEDVTTFPMEDGLIYNIRRNVWHHIVMTPATSVLLVENADTSAENSEYGELTGEVIADLKRIIKL